MTPTMVNIRGQNKDSDKVEEIIETPQSQSEFRCDQCDYVDETKNKIEEHAVSHKATKLNCNQCDYSTEQKTELSEHASKKHMPSTKLNHGGQNQDYEKLEKNYNLLKENYERLIEINKKLLSQNKDKQYAT